MYTITIERSEVEEVVLGKQWEKTGTDAEGKYIYGYTPVTTTRQTVERRIYEQTVAELDLVGVIYAVNRRRVSIDALKAMLRMEAMEANAAEDPEVRGSGGGRDNA